VDNFWHIFFIWLHILGVALFVGPQFFLALAGVPATRQIADRKSRVATVRVVTRRFAWVGGAGLVLIVAAGSYLIADWRDYYGVPDDTGFTDLRFGVVFIVKMTLFLIMLAIVGIHMLFLGPRLVEAMEAQANGERITEAEVRSARMQSVIASVAGLLLALAIMVMGAMLNSTAWSLQ
jgi:uncharacterized membrane protein